MNADNASPSDVMVDNLAVLVPWFQGQASRVHCFTHIINLVAKSLLKPFDGGKLIEVEVEGDGNGKDDDGGDDEEGDPDNVEGWIDERESLSEEEQLALDDAVLLVKTVLVKVRAEAAFRTYCSKPSHQIRKLLLSTVRSTTKRLPEWYHILERLKLAKKTLPRDVPTRWNSTFKMLNTANEYRAAVDELTGNHLMGLHKCEMNDDEFAISKELRDVLLVSHILSVTLSRTLTWSLAGAVLSLRSGMSTLLDSC